MGEKESSIINTTDFFEGNFWWADKHPGEYVNYDDVRMKVVQDFFKNNKPGLHLMNKTTRVGATTSLVLEPLDRHQTVFIAVPTNRIARETIMRDIPLLSTRKDLKIVQLRPNSQCVYNLIRAKNSKDFKLLPTMPLEHDCRSCEGVQCPKGVDRDATKNSPCRDCTKYVIPKCEECQYLVPDECRTCKYKNCSAYKRCRVSEIFKVDKPDVIVSTPQKLATIVQQHLAPRPPRADNTREKLADIIYSKIEDCNVHILDEIHLLQQIGKTNISIIESPLTDSPQLNDSFAFDFKMYNTLSAVDYPTCYEVISTYERLLIHPTTQAAMREAQRRILADGYHEDHIHIPIKGFESNIENKTEFFGMLMQEVTKLIESRFHEFAKIDIVSIARIYQMASVITAHKRSISAYRTTNTYAITLAAPDDAIAEAINEFVRRLLQLDNKYVVLTSATVDETYPYLEEMETTPAYHRRTGALHREGKKLQHHVFGQMGDPMRTNSKMKVFAASRKMSMTHGTQNLTNMSPDITKKIIQLCGVFEVSNILAVAANKSLAKEYKQAIKDLDCYPPNITYYNSDQTIGVQCQQRLGVGIGAAWKGVNVFDYMTDTRHESRVMNEVHTHMDDWQTMSRVKDPAGKIPSAWIFFGVPERDALNYVHYGNRRQIKFKKAEKIGESDETAVTSDGDISTPDVVRWRNFDELIYRVYLHLDSTGLITKNKLRPDEQNEKFLSAKVTKVSNNIPNRLDTFVTYSDKNNCDSWKSFEQTEKNVSEKVTKVSNNIPNKLDTFVTYSDKKTCDSSKPLYESLVRGFAQVEMPKIPVFRGQNFDSEIDVVFNQSEFLRILKPLITDAEICNYAVGDMYLEVNTCDASGLTRFIRFGDIDPSKAYLLSRHLYVYGVPHFVTAEYGESIDVYVLLKSPTHAGRAKTWAGNIAKVCGLKSRGNKYLCTISPSKATHRRGVAETIQIMPGLRIYGMAARDAKLLDDMLVNFKSIKYIGAVDEIRTPVPMASQEPNWLDDGLDLRRRKIDEAEAEWLSEMQAQAIQSEIEDLTEALRAQEEIYRALAAEESYMMEHPEAPEVDFEAEAAIRDAEWVEMWETEHPEEVLAAWEESNKQACDETYREIFAEDRARELAYLRKRMKAILYATVPGISKEEVEERCKNENVKAEMKKFVAERAEEIAAKAMVLLGF